MDMKVLDKLLSPLIGITDTAWLVFCRMSSNDGPDTIDIRVGIINTSSGKAVKSFPVG